jgi:DNA-binding LytR/AlgR family response regulator
LVTQYGVTINELQRPTPLSSEDEILNTVKPRLDPKVTAWALRFSALGFISFLFATAGPFGTYDAGDFGERLLYWFVLICVSVLLAMAIIETNRQYFSHVSFVTRECIAILAMTVIFTAFLEVWTKFAFPGMVNKPPGYFLLASEVLVICAAISLTKYWIPHIVRRANLDEEMPAQPRLARRLPQDFEGQISRLTVNGHKVLVVTSQGHFDLRMRFADAVEEISELEGFCVHRSHWVAKTAIKGVITRNGRPVIVMNNGDEVPVSRKYQRNLEDSGLY